MTGRVDRRVCSLVLGLVVVCAGGLGASSAYAAEACPNEQARAEQPYGLDLPDCRAYEMVSPLEKNDNDAVVMNNSFAYAKVRSAVSGDAFTFDSQGSFANPTGSAYLSQYVAHREHEGWSTRNITPPTGSNGEEFLVQYPDALFTSDLSRGVVRNGNPPLTSDAPEGYIDYYVADLAQGSYQAVTNVQPSGIAPDRFFPPWIFTPFVGGASSDLSHVVFEEKASLTPGAPAGTYNVYEWIDGQLSLVNVESDGTPMSGGAQPGAGIPESGIGKSDGDEWHSVSADGSRVFFTSPVLSEEEEEEYEFGAPTAEHPQVFARVLTPTPRTVEVSASQKTNGSGSGGTDPNGGSQDAFYWAANSEGSKVFFTSNAELTNDANTGSEDNKANLYEYDLETEHLTDLTVDTSPGDVNGAAAVALVDLSEDGSYVYFIAEGDLAGTAVSGQPNLYLSHDGTTTFIATLSRSDSIDWRGGTNGNTALEAPPGSHNRAVGPAENRATRTTPDGTRLAFLSTLRLTGYDNEPAISGECRNEAGVPGPCKEVFVYDASTGHLTCASCNPSGARPVGSSSLDKQGQETLFYIQHNFSESGGLFFESEDALVPHDSNGLNDVYEYADGRVYPISNVAGGQASYFLDASPSGSDVFIGTAGQLLPQDRDNLVDVYDARVGGGFPVSVPPPSCTNGDSCKPPVSPQPAVFGAPASATFSGAGNAAPVNSTTTVKTVIKLKPKSKMRKIGKKRRKGKKARKNRSGATRASHVSGKVKRS